MKRKIILIIAAFALHLASATGAEISLRKYNELPLGSIKPDGWLREMLVRQRDGITATLDKVYPEVVGDRNGWLGGDGDCWERGPYWIDGLLPMAYILNDAELKAKAQRWVDWTLNSQQESGQFGPCKDYPNEPGLQRGRSQDWWPRMVMLKVLMQYYDATSDERVIPFMDKYFRYQLKTLSEKPLGHWSGWAEYRAADNMIAALWLYRHTGEKYLLDLCDVLHEQGHDFTKMFLESDELSRISTIHCVNLSQGLKEPLVYSQV
ncbi:MAG TPA: glycoside hydrolase family 127 protein, partial [Candidatus Cryptobacteroides sp.]|nr:glycoside hydrolase family 127 protein [Candidatus Cryptobacteroides sp.]